MCNMAKKRNWLTIFIALLLVSSIVGHYVGDVVTDDVAWSVDSAETHPLHSSGLASPALNTPEPTANFGIVAAQIVVVQVYAQPPLLRPPIVF